MLKRGWAKRQMENTERNIAAWPRYMKRNSGGYNDHIFIVTLCRSNTIESPRRVGVVAFNRAEAIKKSEEVCWENDGAFLKATTVRELRGVTGEVALARAVFVLAQVMPVYEIMDQGRKEVVRPCRLGERLVRDQRFGLNELGVVRLK